MIMDEAQIIELPKFLDRRGNLSVIEELDAVPFAIARTYWIYDVPGGEKRGGHAYRRNRELIVALSGSFVVTVDDGVSRSTFHLNRSYYGLYVPAGVWRQLSDFSTNSVALVVASEPYDRADYIENYKQFIAYAREKRCTGA
ncbi:MAG: FdtA/QdtA family cupin domain-containing protein [Muribaculaceae bacterium]|nr:FdtA/QdtA family cupin domain-containing protein [Muribaculaceae bacterium]